MRNIGLYILLTGILLCLLYIASNMNKNSGIQSYQNEDGQIYQEEEYIPLSDEERQRSITEDSTKQANEDEIYYTNLVLEKVPLTDDETPELEKYRRDLRRWYEWDNECMGMDPNSKPKDPRILKK